MADDFFILNVLTFLKEYELIFESEQSKNKLSFPVFFLI